MGRIKLYILALLLFLPLKAYSIDREAVLKEYEGGNEAYKKADGYAELVENEKLREYYQKMGFVLFP